AAGHTWNVQFTVNYHPLYPGANVSVTATPLTIAQNPAADPSCQWSTQLNVDDVGGYLTLVHALYAGNVNMLSQRLPIFGTPLLNAYGFLQGTLCFGGITPPASEQIQLSFSGILEQVTVNFPGPIANPSKITASPASITLTAAGSAQTAQTTL